MKYRKIPIEVEAVQWDGTDQCWDKLVEWVDDNSIIGRCYFEQGVYVKTLEGELILSLHDYLVKGLKGEFYPVREDIFEETYELL